MKLKLSLLLSAALVAGCAPQGHKSAANGSSEGQPGSAASDPASRQAYFGDLHLHTTYSFDAYSMMGTKTTPDEAYKFARGLPITYQGHTVQRYEPLDFTAVTDHSEFQGVLNQLDDPNSALSKSKLGAQFRADPLKTFFTLGKFWRNQGAAPPELKAKERMVETWKVEIKAADDNYVPGKFTTFHAYEWTSMPDNKYNLHRNVFFKDKPPSLPFSSADSNRPEDLWTYMENLRKQGIEGLVIPHNSNASGGLMFDWKDSAGRPIDEAYAQRRATNEPLVEIHQNKGNSETAPDLSANDEFANFEVFEKLLTGGPSNPNGSYVRQALGRGLVIQAKVKANPYKFGFVGATDFHNGLTTGREDAFAGGLFGIDARTDLPAKEEAAHLVNPSIPAPKPGAGSKVTNRLTTEVFTDPTEFGSGGLTGVWAEQNTRPSIFAALKRRETFATSGTRMKVRAFGGWNYDPALTQHANWAAQAYAGGVPMGGDLPAKASGAPRFVLQAMKDPNGANLDRIQVVKVWLEGGDYKEKVFDAVWSGGRIPDKAGHIPAVGNTVDVKTAGYKNTIGAPQLAAVWTDPAFDASKPAVYYVRALEIPTPRWTTILAAKRGLPTPARGPLTLQERAWASPIWYTPAGAAKPIAAAPSSSRKAS